MYRLPYRRAFKAADGTVRIELLDRTEISLEEWRGNPEKYRVIDNPRDREEPQQEEPSWM